MTNFRTPSDELRLHLEDVERQIEQAKERAKKDGDTRLLNNLRRERRNIRAALGLS